MIYRNFGRFEDLEYFELGYAPWGIKDLLWTVFFYKLGDSLIDTGSFKTRKYIPEFHTDPPTQILLTHFHEDHSGNAAYFKKKYNAEVYAHPLTLEKLQNSFPIQFYEKIMFGKVEPICPNPFPRQLYLGKESVEIEHVPGHSPDHCCFYLKERGWLFSGDMYVADKIKLWRKSEDLDHQIEGLDRLLELDFDVLLCAHNPQFTQGKERLRAKREFLYNFRGLVRERAHMSNAQIMKELKMKERYMVKWITQSDVSVENLFDAARSGSYKKK